MNRPANQFDWIFFDVGGPLLVDEQAHARRIDVDLHVLRKYLPQLKRKDIEDIWPEACMRLGNVDKNVAELLLVDPVLAQKAIVEIKAEKAKLPYYLELSHVRLGAADVCKQLAGTYKLGLIANQASAVKPILLQAGVLQHFAHQKVSEDYGLEKPDPKYYQRVLDETGANPVRSVMIDDNIERSLFPAKALGFTTVWYALNDREKLPPNAYDFKIKKLDELLAIFR